MQNVKLFYRYRCYGNYKNPNSVVFANPDNLSLDEILHDIEANLIDGQWFYASKWEVPDMHFEKYDDELDHSFHEFDSVAYTDQLVTDERTIDQFLQLVKHVGPHYVL